MSDQNNDTGGIHRGQEGLAGALARGPGIDSSFFASIAHRMNNMIFVILDDRIVYANRQSEHVLGYSRDELYADKLSFRHLVSPEMQDEVTEKLSLQLQDEQVEPFMCPLVAEDGRKMEVIVSTELMPFDGRNAVVAVVTDLSPYRRLESHIEGNRELIEPYFDIAPVIMLVLDTNGVVKLINKRGAEILGYEVEEVVGKHWCSNFVPVDSRPHQESLFRRAICEELDLNEKNESDVLTRDHVKKTIEWRNSFIRNPDGEIEGILSSGLDITSEKAVTDALIESEKVHRDFVDNVPIGIFRSTPGGRLLMANTAFVRMLGYESLEELARLNVNKGLYHPDTPRKKFQQAVEVDGKIEGYQAKLLKKDGSVLYGREYARAVRDDEGKTVYYEGTVEDISDRVEAEWKLDYRIEMEKLISRISTRFVNLAPDEVDSGITSALKAIAGFVNADRAYVCLFRDEGSTLEWTHRWYPANEHLSSDERRQVSSDYFSWIAQRIYNKRMIRVPRVEDLPDEAENEKSELESDDIQSTVMVPLVCGASVLGFAGFEYIWYERNWTDEEIGLLKLMSEILASVLERKRVEEELLYRLQLEELVASISARFVSITSESVLSEISRSLSALGEFLDVDACSIYDLQEGNNLSVVAEWHASQDVRDQAERSRLDCDQVPYTWDRLLNGETVQIRDITDLPGEASKDREYLQRAGIRSMLCIPFVWGQEGTGVLAFMSREEPCSWNENTVSLVRMVAELFGSALDVKEANVALEKERRLMESMMHTIPDFIYFKDSEGRFLRSNEAHAASFGMTPEDIVGKSDRELLPESYAQEAESDEKQVMQTGQPIVAKREKLPFPGGRELWVSTTKAPLRESSGRLVGTIGVSRDITQHVNAEQERLKMESRMQQAQKLESLGVLSGGIAHDFNNLLMGILGNTGLALMEMSEGSSAWNYIKEIETVAMRAADLTNQMLAYSGKSKSVIKPVDVSNLVSEMAHLLEVTISDRIDINYSFNKDLPAVEGDASQIRQVVMNLITNASDAVGNSDGKIDVETGVNHYDQAFLQSCYLSGEIPAGEYVYIRVADSGCGMDKKTLGKIFDPFFTTKVSGRGLGLAAVLGIVRSHKGALRVDTEVGEGTTFTVLLPVSGETVSDEETGQDDISRWQGEGTVLVVDDDEVVRVVSEQILRKFGFSVITAGNCDSGARTMARETSIDAVLLDVTLTGANGSGALQELHGINSDIPIILMSGYNEQRATENLRSEDYAGFIQKPFTAEKLANLLKKVMQP
jgi:PAS domain S-box-containing protein